MSLALRKKSWPWLWNISRSLRKILDLGSLTKSLITKLIKRDNCSYLDIPIQYQQYTLGLHSAMWGQQPPDRSIPSWISAFSSPRSLVIIFSHVEGGLPGRGGSLWYFSRSSKIIWFHLRFHPDKPHAIHCKTSELKNNSSECSAVLRLTW